MIVAGSHTLWLSTAGSGALGQLNRVTIAHNQANIQAVVLPGLPRGTTCPSGESVLTDVDFGVPAFTGLRGRVTVSWTGCGLRVHFGTWATTDGGRRWYRAGTLFPGVAGNQ